MALKTYPAYFIYTPDPFAGYEDIYYIIFPDLLMDIKPYPMKEIETRYRGSSTTKEVIDRRHPDFRRINDWNNQGKDFEFAPNIDSVMEAASYCLGRTLEVRKGNGLETIEPSGVEKLTLEYFETERLKNIDYYDTMSEEIELSKSFTSYVSVDDTDFKRRTHRTTSEDCVLVKVQIPRKNYTAAVKLGIDIQKVGLRAI